MAALEACPEVHRNWEWRYVERLCRLERYAVKPTTAGAGVNRLPAVFMPDGKSWVVGAAVGDSVNRLSVLQLWDTESGRCLGNLASDTLPRIASLAASPDGRFVAVSFEDNVPIQVRQIPGGRLVQKLFPGGAWGQTWDMAISPDGRRLIDGRTNGKVVLWDLVNAQPLRAIDTHSPYVKAVAFHPDGRLVASGGTDGLIRVWDAESGAAVRTIKAARRGDFRPLVQLGSTEASVGRVGPDPADLGCGHRVRSRWRSRASRVSSVVRNSWPAETASPPRAARWWRSGTPRVAGLCLG